METNPFEWLESIAAADPDRTLLDLDSGRVSYRAFSLLSHALANSLSAKGVGRGDAVPIFSGRYDTVLAGMFASWRLGATALPMNLTLTGAARAAVLKATRSAVALADLELAPRLGTDHPEIRVVEPCDVPANAATSSSLDLNVLDVDCFLNFTSGTTGVPKGVRLSPRKIAANGAAAAQFLGLKEDTRLFVNSPPFYMSGIIHFLTALSVGGAIISRQGFYFGADLLRILAETRATGFGGAPVHLNRVIAEPSAPSAALLKGLSFWMSSGDALPTANIRSFNAMFPAVRVVVMYGLTELAGRICAIDLGADPAGIGSVGRPLPNMKVSILDPSGRACRVEETGEIHVESPLRMSGYLGATASAPSPESPAAFPTGDFGHVDEAGRIWLEGRRDDIFKSGGEKVSLQLVRTALSECGEFADFEAIALPHEVMGHVPAAAVVPKNPSTFEPRLSLRMLRSKLPASHVPKSLKVVESVPRTGSGKVLRSAVLEMFKQEACH